MNIIIFEIASFSVITGIDLLLTVTFLCQWSSYWKAKFRHTKEPSNTFSVLAVTAFWTMFGACLTGASGLFAYFEIPPFDSNQEIINDISTIIGATATVARLEFYIWRLKYTFKSSIYHIDWITIIIFHIFIFIVFIARIISIINWIYNDYINYLNIINSTLSLIISISVSYLFNKKLLKMITQHMSYERNSINIYNYIEMSGNNNNSNNINNTNNINNSSEYEQSEIDYEEQSRQTKLTSITSITGITTATKHKTTMMQVEAWDANESEIDFDFDNLSSNNKKRQYSNNITLLNTVTKQTMLVTCDVIITIITLMAYLAYYAIFETYITAVIFWIILTIDFIVIPLTLWLSFKFAHNQYKLICRFNHRICLQCCKYVALWKVNTIHLQSINYRLLTNG